MFAMSSMRLDSCLEDSLEVGISTPSTNMWMIHVPRGYNTKGGSNGHFNHADPRSTFLLSSLDDPSRLSLTKLINVFVVFDDVSRVHQLLF